MIDISWLWAVFTVLAAAGQTARNAMQRELTATLGTVGATHVRFLFGFPFALIFLLGVVLATGTPLPRPSLNYVPWLLCGALFQIGATRDDACRDGAALLRGRRRLYQDRADPGRDLRGDLPRRSGQPSDDGRDRDRDGGLSL